MAEFKETKVKPGVIMPWEEKARELPPIEGDADLVKQVWEHNEAFAYLFVWHCLVSF
jgi:hypothetical protein